ncbi:YaiO family outer membrane protein [Mucilaginibacter oryzae]|uniref:YaiO family outer membrane protein n=1 Tax=Mucilaginibacter oryzae TaxID=468058 RepID=A0A316H4R5_9SPHI|nr:tetratricopeptide repeat protein [Mucilaginibacter oryzae]PWK70816.1 YaiO family outer membrane protein [Mucilaginibacter oryzae]
MRPTYFFIITICFLLLGNILYAQTWNSVKAEKLYQQGLAESKTKQQAKAIPLLEEAVMLNPKHIDAQVLLAKLYMNAKRYDQTIKTAQLVIKASPRYEDVYYYIIGACLSTNHNEDALKYTDLALTYFPQNKVFAVKKLNILDLLKSFQDGDSWAQSLLRQYPTDQGARQSVAGHYEAKADWYTRNNLSDMARKNYEKALELVPANKDLVDKLNGLVSKGGDTDAKIAKANEALNANSKSYQALYYKLGLLQEAGRYAEALDVLHTILRYYPNDKKANILNTSLRKEAASHYQNTQAYALYQSVLDQNPNDQEALQKVIGQATSMGDLNQALYRADRALQREPGNNQLLRQKMALEYQLHHYKAAADLAARLYNANSDKTFKSEVMQTINSCGNYYLQQQSADSALIYYKRALLLEPGNQTALQGRINGFMLKNDLNLALKELDGAIELYPANAAFKIKKAGILAQAGKIREAAKLSEQLFKQNPDDPELRSLYLDQRLAAANACILAEAYDEAEGYLREVLKEDTGNRDALNYLVNTLDLQKRYTEALTTVNLALTRYPDDRDFLQKKASVLYNARQYASAGKLAGALYGEFPFNVKYRQMAGDAWMAAGQDYRKRKLADSALFSVERAIAIKPADSVALLLKTNILIEQRRFGQALGTADEALRRYEYAEPFLLRKAIILDSLKRYSEAANYADTLNKRYNTVKNEDYAALLRGKTLYNSFGLSLLNSSFSSVDGASAPTAYNIAMLDYNRSDTGKISYGGAVTFLGRQQGTGVMAEGNLSYKYSKTLYWTASLGLSNNVILPKYRIAYSLLPTFGNGIETEFGARYFEVAGISVLSAVTGLGKEFGPFGVNTRLFGILQKSNAYFAFTALARYNLTEQDLLQANFGLGSSPDDINRLITFPRLRGILSRTVGASYRRTFSYRTSIGLAGNYTNQKITDNSFYNQYDLQLSLRVKF